MQKQNEQNYYFLTIDHNRMIDAGPKGNLSRYIMTSNLMYKYQIRMGF